MKAAAKSKIRRVSKRFAKRCTKFSRRKMKQASESLSPFVDRFLASMAVEKGLAKNTLEAYSRDLSQVIEFLLEQGVTSWSAVESLQVRSYLGYLRRRKLANRIIVRRLVSLRRLYR